MLPLVETLIALRDSRDYREFNRIYSRAGELVQSEYHWFLAGKCPAEYGGQKHLLCGCDCEATNQSDQPLC
jgi:hypothetical protein